MPSGLIDVPVNGDGISSDLRNFGFAKTFTAQGSDQFDALVMVDGTFGPAPVGRLKGQNTTIIESWGVNFFLRRIDDGANTDPVTVSVDAKVNLGAVQSKNVRLETVNQILEESVVDLDEPLTIVCTTQNPNPGAVVEVFNKTADGVEAPVGRIVPGAKLNINSGIDVTILGFRYVVGDPDAGQVTCRIYGSTPQNMSPVWAAGVVGIGDPGYVTFQSDRTPGRLVGLTRQGVGTYLLSFTPPPSSEVSASITPHNIFGSTQPYIYAARQNGLQNQEQIITIRDLAGNLVDPTEALQVFAVIWSPLAL